MQADIVPALFGLAAAATWGAGDFCGGLATKRANVYAVVILGDVVGGLLLSTLAMGFGEPLPPMEELLWGAVAGLAGAVGLLALYRALALGRMSVASPVAAIITAALPVVFGAFVEGLPGGWQILGFGFALVGVWLISDDKTARAHLNELGLPLVAGLGFGIFFVIIGSVSREVALWPLVAARAAAVLVLSLFALATRQLQLPKFEHLPLVALVGVLDAGGNAFFALAAQAGRLDVAAVLSSLYPASTVWLAWLILKERIHRWQFIGIVAALAAILLITL